MISITWRYYLSITTTCSTICSQSIVVVYIWSSVFYHNFSYSSSCLHWYQYLCYLIKYYICICSKIYIYTSINIFSCYFTYCICRNCGCIWNSIIYCISDCSLKSTFYCRDYIYRIILETTHRGSISTTDVLETRSFIRSHVEAPSVPITRRRRPEIGVLT